MGKDPEVTLGTAYFIAGLFRVSAPVLPIVTATFGAGVWLLIERFRHRNLEADRNPAAPALPIAIAPVMLVIFGSAFIAAQAPPNALDEVAYHLAIPSEWGRFRP